MQVASPISVQSLIILRVSYYIQYTYEYVNINLSF